jgi:hypothetical protein
LPWPVAVTARAWLDTIARPPILPEQHHQPQPYESEEGRLLDLLWMVKTAHETSRPQRRRGSGHRYQLTLWRVSAPAPSRKAQPVRLTLTVHTGDLGEPVATLAHQDQRPRWWQRHHHTAALVLLPATVVVVMFRPLSHVAGQVSSCPATIFTPTP